MNIPEFEENSRSEHISLKKHLSHLHSSFQQHQPDWILRKHSWVDHLIQVRQIDGISNSSHWSFEEVIVLSFSTSLDVQVVESLSGVVEEHDPQREDLQGEQHSRIHQQKLSYTG